MTVTTGDVATPDIQTGTRWKQHGRTGENMAGSSRDAVSLTKII